MCVESAISERASASEKGDTAAKNLVNHVDTLGRGVPGKKNRKAKAQGRVCLPEFSKVVSLW